jgi:uroporphyrinogen decarboxylase
MPVAISHGEVIMPTRRFAIVVNPQLGTEYSALERQLTDRENWLRAVQFRNPEWIPCSIDLSPLTWLTYGRELEKVILSHRDLFPHYEEGRIPYSDGLPPYFRKGEFLRDHWGCGWRNEIDGLEGQVVEHPLADWNAFETFVPPDPLLWAEREPRNWTATRSMIEERRRKGLLTSGNGERLFDRLYFLRGFENLMMDFATDDPHLVPLIEKVTDCEMKLIRLWLDLGVETMAFHTDIGAQKSLMISPAKFRKYIKPMFMKLFRACQEGGALVYLSSDGCLLEIVDDLIECGVAVHDPQLRANTLEGIKRAYKGKMCARVDLDRQSFPFATPAQLREQVREVVETMAAPEGGLMVLAAIYGNDVSLKNIEAICQAMQEYCLSWRA